MNVLFQCNLLAETVLDVGSKDISVNLRYFPNEDFKRIVTNRAAVIF